MKERIAGALRGLADRLAKAEPEKIVLAPTPEAADDEDMPWSIAAPVVVLTAEAERMLEAARVRTPKSKDEPEGPAPGSAWYRYLMASAKQENGQ